MTERTYLAEVVSRQSFRRRVFTQPRPLAGADFAKSQPNLHIPQHVWDYSVDEGICWASRDEQKRGRFTLVSEHSTASH
jgi:hypothetical protein